MLTQMFNATEKVVSFAEPNCLYYLSIVYDRMQESYDTGLDTEVFERLAKNVIRLLCKRTEGDEIAYFIKKPYKSSSVIKKASLFKFFCKNDATLRERFGRKKLLSNEINRIKIDSEYAYCMWRWLISSYLYLKFSKMIQNYPAIRYEDIVESPSEAMNTIFSHWNLSIDLVPKAVRALKWDSQANTSLSTEIQKRISDLSFDEEARTECNQLADQLGLPKLTEKNYVLVNTITQMNGHQ
ncbi:hypothetical protein HELRODRAFT_168486 [Helobdella robusta]|uniref:Uncharacterized protein n=1 Tax=Helobdella robusta TaxID=6412 RepID=T1F0M4_HELRO|nr:hypothetical protein HELRODRAFT_168486 [Helobdella robusta]ESO09493.1 hypothetical protein HELRODRAFT_168486 [Helobdella robusta]